MVAGDRTGSIDDAARRLRARAASPWGRAGDVAVAVVDEAGRILVAARTPARHVVAAGEVVSAIRDRFPGALEPGDVLVHNDPHTGGTSLVDLTVVSIAGPGDRRRFGVARMRMLDAGGGEPGGVFPRAGQVIQEGDRVPPVRIAEQGRLLPDIVRRLSINTRRRSGYERDLDALVEAATEASAVTGDGEAAASTTTAPPGEARATVIVLGSLLRSPRRISVRVAADADRFDVDFEGTDPADAGSGNVPWSATMAAALEALQASLGGTEPLEALAPRVRWSAPSGCFVRPSAPAACSAGGLYSSFAVRRVVATALSSLGLPHIDWPAWSAGAVLAGTPGAEYETLVPLDCPGSLEELGSAGDAIDVVPLAVERWGRQVRLESGREGLRLTAWQMEIEGAAPPSLLAPLDRVGLPATLWLSLPDLG